MRISPTPRAPRIGRAGVIFFFYGLLALLGTAWSALRGQPNVLLYQREGFASVALGPAQLVSSLALGTAVGLMVVLLTRMLEERYQWARVLHNEFHHILGSLSREEILLLAVASALGEEIFFRGALLGQLQASLGAGLGVVLSSVIFALLHIGPGTRFLPWTGLSLAMGVLLALTFIAAGDLLAPIAVHFTVNLLNLHEIVRRPAVS